MSAPRHINAGHVRYRIDFVPNPNYQGSRGGGLFSEELHAKILRHNSPQSRVVYFDGRRSRAEEVKNDYGVRSLSFELREAGRDTVTYCKEFPNLNFCVEHPVLLPPGGEPPYLAPTEEEETIAGMRCRKAEYQGNAHLFVWYTEDAAVNDPTGAVLRLEGVPGLILQTEEIPSSDSIDSVRRVTVVELSSDAPPPEIFSPPADYRSFADLDAARAEDRRLLEEKSAEELQRSPLDDKEREMFAGEWLYDSPRDKIKVEIAREGGGEFRFTTTVLTAPEGEAGRVSVERASMKGRLLFVEQPPNYRLYKLADGGRSLVPVGYESFTFRRV